MVKEVKDISKHTPGPWEWKDLEPNWQYLSSVLGGNIINSISEYELTPEDAALIAAAPDLYEENERLRKYVADLLEAAKIGLDSAIKLELEKNRDCFNGTCPFCIERRNNVNKIQSVIKAGEVENER